MDEAIQSLRAAYTLVQSHLPEEIVPHVSALFAILAAYVLFRSGWKGAKFAGKTVRPLFVDRASDVGGAVLMWLEPGYSTLSDLDTDFMRAGPVGILFDDGLTLLFRKRKKVIGIRQHLQGEPQGITDLTRADRRLIRKRALSVRKELISRADADRRRTLVRGLTSKDRMDPSPCANDCGCQPLVFTASSSEPAPLPTKRTPTPFCLPVPTPNHAPTNPQVH